MLVIRLRRIGRKHDPHYRIVVTEHTAPVQGKFLAEIGHYHPKTKEFVIDQPVFMAWLDKGAKPSNTVARLAQTAKLAHKHIAPKQLMGQPKKKAQAAATAKAEAKLEPAKPTETPEEVAAEPEPTAEADATEAVSDTLESPALEPVDPDTETPSA